jgi:hypothetical protein
MENIPTNIYNTVFNQSVRSTEGGPVISGFWVELSSLPFLITNIHYC